MAPSLRRAASFQVQQKAKKTNVGTPEKSIMDDDGAASMFSHHDESCGALTTSVLSIIMGGQDRRGHSRRRAKEKATEWAVSDDPEKIAAAQRIYQRIDICDLCEKLSDASWLLKCDRAELHKCDELVRLEVELSQNVRVDMPTFC